MDRRSDIAVGGTFWVRTTSRSAFPYTWFNCASTALTYGTVIVAGTTAVLIVVVVLGMVVEVGATVVAEVGGSVVEAAVTEGADVDVGAACAWPPHPPAATIASTPNTHNVRLIASHEVSRRAQG